MEDWRGCTTVTSQAVSLPPVQYGRKISAGFNISTTDNIKNDPKVVRLQWYSLNLRDQMLTLQHYSDEQTKSVTHGENLLREVNSTTGDATAACLIPKIKALMKKTTDPEVLKLLNDMVAAITGMKEDFPDRMEAAVSKALGDKFPLMMVKLSNMERMVGSSSKCCNNRTRCCSSRHSSSRLCTSWCSSWCRRSRWEGY